MRPQLVADWRHSWRWWSVHAMILAGALQGAYLAVPADLVHWLPRWSGYAITTALMICGIAGRLTAQPKRRAS